MSPGVLITRPEAAARPLAKKIAALGYRPILSPMLDIHHLGPPAEIDGVGALAFTSARGVEAVADDLRLRHLPVFTVGTATAMAARAAGFRVAGAGAGGVQSMVELIVSTWPKSDGAVLHISGRDVRGDLVADLTSGGVPARRHIAYVAQRAPQLTAAAEMALVAGEVSAALFYSARTATTFTLLARAAEAEHRLGGVIAIAMSPGVIAALGEIHWSRVAVAEVISEDAMIQCLTRELVLAKDGA